jgi:arylsulfatase A-like enzyme
MKKKNVLLITVDQWCGQDMGCAGNQRLLTPTLDEMAGYGIRFTNAYSSTPVCIPARRELMTGTCAQTHGDRRFNERLEMPDLPTMAQVFRENGYQTYAVGKLHVYPQRNRIGFDDVLLNEEGRHLSGLRQDDYERFLAREGYAGLEFAHGMNNNNYLSRPFHLPEYLHPTAWTVREMCEVIKRRDPTRPSFWYASFNAPHPPLAPPKDYWDMYDEDFEKPRVGEWCSQKEQDLPYPYLYYSRFYHIRSPKQLKIAYQGYYATCTHIDHQIRLLVGTLREEGVLDDTIILFTADHGEMLGRNNMWGKHLLFENSMKIPFILMPTMDTKFTCGTTDDRFVELQDVMPTLLHMAGLTVPDTVEGMDLMEGKTRETVYGELWEDDRATRMVRKGNWKLIYYPVGNCVQLFNLADDPHELHDLAKEPENRQKIAELKDEIIPRLYGGDLKWIKNKDLVGLPPKVYSLKSAVNDGGKLYQGRDMLLQRGIR